MSKLTRPRKIAVSIGLLARNEESRIPAALDSLFRQTLFTQLDRRGQRAEIWCVANACTDDTAAVAARLFQAQETSHPHAEAILAKAVSVATPGKINAWNLFVHEISDHESQYLILMDADIELVEDDALWNLVRGLEENFEANVTVDEPIKDIALRPATSIRERLSLATSRLTGSSSGQLTGQLYCIRAEIARAIRLPRDLAACEDGFIKCMVATDFLQNPSNPERILKVDGASHVFEAYTTASAIIRNQKRQMIGQTFVHVLVDKHLPDLCVKMVCEPSEVIRQLDESDPEWLRDLINNHVRDSRHFWRLFPNVCSFRLKRWSKLPAGRKLKHLPATLLGTGVTLVASWMAYRALSRGNMGYWPGKPPRADQPPSSRTAETFDFAQRAASA